MLLLRPNLLPPTATLPVSGIFKCLVGIWPKKQRQFQPELVLTLIFPKTFLGLIESINSNIGTVKIGTLNALADEIKNRVDEVDGDIYTINGELKSIKSDISGHSGRLGGIDTSITNHTTTLGGLSTGVSNNLASINALNTKTDDTNKNVATNLTSINKISGNQTGKLERGSLIDLIISEGNKLKIV